jgi:hypothetical protein
MDSTLADIILPMLKQMKATKHGSPTVDDDDIPDHLRGTTTEDWDAQHTFDFYREHQIQEGERDIHARWEWVLDEMIFAFEHYVDDTWEEAFRSGEHDMIHVPCEWYEDGKPKLYKIEKGPNDTYVCDYEGMNKVYKRMENGFHLFGKYYRGLWD